MIYLIAGFLFGLLIPYMARRFAKFMPATPAYAIYRLIKPNKKAKKNNAKYRKMLQAYLKRSLTYAIVASALSFAVAYKFDSNIWWYIGLVWLLLLLSEIDFKMLLLPDILTIPLLLSGFVFACFANQYISPQESAIAATAGYVLPVVATLLMLWRSFDAFGGGDIKLLAALGAWLGLEGVIYTILLSCLLFAVYSLIRKQRAGAFGPALAVSAIVILFLIF